MFNDLLQLPLYTAPTATSNTKVTYTHHGSGDLLVLVHGSLCDVRYWRWQLNRLHTSCQVVALSLPGYWPDDLYSAPNAYNFEAHVAAVAEVVDLLRQPHQKLYVLGHSRGAQIAANYAWQNNAHIDGLILADAAFTVGQTSPPLPIIQEASSLLMTGEDDKGLGLFIDAVSGSNTWGQMVGWFKTMVQDNATTLIPQSQEILPTVTQKQIQRLRNTPVLLMNGAQSPERYQNSTQTLLNLLPQAEHTLIEKASHGMNLANPKAFNRAVVEFINQTYVL